MARPIYVWRLDELRGKTTIRITGGAELKIEDANYRLWLRGDIIIEEERGQGDAWCEIVRKQAKLT